MKRLMLVLVVSVLSLGLLAGCHKKAKPPVAKAKKKIQRTNAVAVVEPPVETPPPRHPIKPGSIQYLDYRNGFRDVFFYQPESSITNAVLRKQDEQHQLKTFTRPGEEMSLNNIPLESVEYSFFKGQLCQIVVKWRVEQKAGASTSPPVAALTPFCASLYGPPSQQTKKKGETELRWQGQRVVLILSESVIPGVRDKINGGWAIPPVASGLMVMENINLRRALKATLASATEQRADGL
jgi:hypothetical protein